LNPRPINYARLRKLARELLQTQLEPPVDVETIARSLGAEVQQLDLEDDISGILFREDGAKIIVVNQRHRLTRQRFTIAHEIGHLVLHRGEPVHVDQRFRINLRNPLSSAGADVEEVEANAFAADLLMPAHWLRRERRADFIDADDEQEISTLAKRYQVSQQAMLIRLTAIFRSSEVQLPGKSL
jgi:Zn-dependent peptidase ImmA (M78 family)